MTNVFTKPLVDGITFVIILIIGHLVYFGEVVNKVHFQPSTQVDLINVKKIGLVVEQKKKPPKTERVPKQVSTLIVFH